MIKFNIFNLYSKSKINWKRKAIIKNSDINFNLPIKGTKDNIN